MISDEDYDKAMALIKENPDRAAYQLADLADRYKELHATVAAVRCLTQNTNIALYGDASQIEFALGRKLSK